MYQFLSDLWLWHTFLVNPLAFITRTSIVGSIVGENLFRITISCLNLLEQLFRRPHFPIAPKEWLEYWGAFAHPWNIKLIAF
jgi:hypothetical protein